MVLMSWVKEEEFEDTRMANKKYKRTSNDLQNIHRKLKID